MDPDAPTREPFIHDADGGLAWGRRQVASCFLRPFLLVGIYLPPALGWDLNSASAFYERPIDAAQRRGE